LDFISLMLVVTTGWRERDVHTAAQRRPSIDSEPMDVVFHVIRALDQAETLHRIIKRDCALHKSLPRILINVAQRDIVTYSLSKKQKKKEL
jgi:hypothetical protein